MVGAELPMTSDQVIWSEQNRLHIAYDDCTQTGAGNTINVNPGAAADIANVVSPRSTIVVMDDFGNEVKCLVTASNTATFVLTVEPYTAATLAAAGIVGNVKVFVYGSEYGKGSITPNAPGAPGAVTGTQYISVDPSFTQFSNNPIIIRNKYVVNGSDMAQIGWIEVATEDGTSGYLWYLKAESETRLRFEDYLEMAMVEAEKKGGGGVSLEGSEGLFAAIEDRGNVYNDFAGAAAPGAGALGDFDTILKQLDTQGAIEENMLFLDLSLIHI